MSNTLEPDQIGTRWDEHVAGYETVFEPFTLALTRPALARLGIKAGSSVLDVGAGPGALALELAGLGCRVAAIDVSAEMVARTHARADAAGLGGQVETRCMNALSIDYPDDCFDLALSAFAIVLVPDAAMALAEMRRVVRPGGRVAVVTWTEPQRYELAATLGAAISEVWPDRPSPPLPAQLRFRERDAFARLFADAGCPAPEIETVEAWLEAPSVDWLTDNLAFAPGMTSMLAGLGDKRAATLESFARILTGRFGAGPVRLGGVGFIGVCTMV
jgi:SAM-dependent methyltransferase